MNNRINKIISLYKKATTDTDILETRTKEIQEALLNAGYSLPRYGADGELGGETYKALLQFKKEHGLPTTRTFTESDLEKLKALSNSGSVVKLPAPFAPEVAGIGEGRVLSNQGEATGGTLLFGDSQMQGGIGQVLEGKFGGTRLSKAGTSAKYWVNNQQLEVELRKKPKNIIIQLNGNGIAGTSELLDKIKRITPNSNITWYGSPPATLKQSSAYSVVKTEGNVKSFNKTRKANNDTVAGMLASSGLNGNFIDPFSDLFKVSPEDPRPYECSKCDGVHVPMAIAQTLYA